MRKILSLGLALAWIVTGSGLVVAASKKKAAAKSTSTSSKSTPKSAKSGKSGGTSKSSGKKGSSTAKGSSKKSSSKKKTSATTWRNRQTAPAPERVKEIQDALVAKGYLAAEDATGAWGQPSIDALKKFQAEQNLQTTGKINSLSLIALGLGPKREPVAIAKPQDAEPPAAPPPALASPVQ